mmetsp:Transcript_27317/g.74726  ORF Transcript_27317/g.74726 Transcript_27317/m.74726 type:complete len:291 (-) Transcript_27317:576-1448(-)|eukprot:CAMPEP_0172359712 /NCGR_PEP_ID=MMETSP1060-20121228/3889_1 /TAXON_ID=37318 /ORGANISM="Pseudo-nitzschia pungens, Strain cf. cingulata" /LENGTH=290 /DNA_ID=CAMNT_0013081493 /DNA_START=47 /DNA_END=919 /DNA_ORIENTATION=-
MNALLLGTCTYLLFGEAVVSGLSLRPLEGAPSSSSTSTPASSDTRRGFFGSALATIAAPATIALSPSPAKARDELFKPNPLTNPVLEQLRIWEQAEKDTIQYNGELEAGNAGNRGRVDFYPALLIPILKIDAELREVRTLVRSGGETETEGSSSSSSSNKLSTDAMTRALDILRTPTYDKINFKKTFNKYGDNIYYNDPDRANLYLGGGATPKTEQSIAYLLRNDVLTNVENLRAELEYLLKLSDTERDSEPKEDLYSYADICSSAMAKYLAQVPPGQMEEAKRLMAAER